MYKILVYITYLAINKKNLCSELFNTKICMFLTRYCTSKCSALMIAIFKSHKYGTLKFSPFCPFSLVPFNSFVWPNH